jgi:hypothetical protein
VAAAHLAQGCEVALSISRGIQRRRISEARTARGSRTAWTNQQSGQSARRKPSRQTLAGVFSAQAALPERRVSASKVAAMKVRTACISGAGCGKWRRESVDRKASSAAS